MTARRRDSGGGRPPYRPERPAPPARCRRGDDGHHGGPATVTQAELMELLLLREQAAASEDLRQDLLRRLDGGAAVELGPLRPEVRVSYERRLTVGTLIPLLGEERVGELKALVERTEVRKLLVHGPA